MAVLSCCQRAVSSASSWRAVGELGAQGGQPLQRGRVVLLGQRHLLDLQAADRALDLVDLDRAAVDLHAQPAGRLVDQVDGLVGQEAGGDVAVGQGGGGDDRGVGDPDPVVHLVALLEPAQDADGVLDARLADEHLLEAPLERRVLLDVLAVLVQRGGADHAQLTAGQHRLDHVAGVHGGLAAGAGADDGVQLVDEGDDLRRSESVISCEHGLEPLLELAAVLRAGHHRGQVQRHEALALAGSPGRRRRRSAGRGPRRSRSCRRRARRSAPGCSWCGGTAPARRGGSRCPGR